ncbi:cellobiose transport system permease protein [Actinoalloteichus hymeniacidonis]|uniref:Cellobiose ABC transporter membrane protein n=1 Tax=Actinoalloteichus hymeniacidonis TaxID=340345 RepID=A0AAC9MZC8_9PSEU|nr:cellobiose ABC transporter membrane protein [Actinoalloteichus hymeniacidonis]MBB5907598.1 cellobiose transport system permease protein [Actinoalloteichus hymeniacidonis]
MSSLTVGTSGSSDPESRETDDDPAPPGDHGGRQSLRDRLNHWDVRYSPYLYIAPFFIIFAIVGLFPLLYTSYVSLFDWSLVADEPVFIGLDNYVELMGDARFWQAMVNTLSIFILSTAPQLVMALLFAVLLDAHLRARTTFRVALLLPYVASLVALGIIFGNLFNQEYGLINGVLGLVGIDPIDWHANRFLSHVAIASMVNWRWTGYNALIILAAMQAIPRDLYEAATVDGAGRWRRFISVTLPMLRPTMIFVVITATVGGLQIFTEPKLFAEVPGSNNGGSTGQFQTVTLFMYQQGFENFELGYASATAWILFLVIVIFALINFWITRRISTTEDPR